MQYMMDLIAAILIGASILIIVFAVVLRGQQTSVGALQHQVAKKGVIALAEMMEQDFKNIGAGKVKAATAVVRFDTAGTTRRFVFWGRTDRLAAPDSQRICYRWSQVDSVLVKSGTGYTRLPAFQVERLVNANATCTTGAVRGLSMGAVTEFRMDLFDRSGASCSPPAPGCGAQVRVSVVAASPLGPGQVIERTAWSTTFRPVNLTRP